MPIRENFLAVLNGYENAKKETFQGHPLAAKIRNELAEAVHQSIPNDDSLHLVKASAGQSRWVRGPWVAIFNRLVTESAQRGFYPVYLFKEDMSGLYLSLNQGMTEAKERYASNAKVSLKARAENFRAMLGPDIHPFVDSEIDLAPSQPGNDTAFYEAGNICAVYYPAKSLPSEAVLAGHLMRALQLYQALIDAGAAEEQKDETEVQTFIEGNGQVRTHLRIERNQKLAREVKRRKGTVCEACDLDFSKMYGALGDGYIEAHHKLPFARLTGNAIPLHPIRDFAVLCANCHRMIHRMEDASDVNALRATVKANRTKQ